MLFIPKGCKVRLRHLYKLYHPKVIVIDDKIVVIGSHNYSYTAFAANREISMIVNSTELADRLEVVFDKDWKVSVS